MVLCPCGKPARRKYCSDQCARKVCAKRIRNTDAYRARMREYLKQWHARNPEKRKLYAKKNPEAKRELKRMEYIRNRAKYRAKAQEYYRKNADKIKAKVREWRLANLEYHKAVKAEYRRKNKAILAAKQKARYYDHYRPVQQVYRKKHAAEIKAWTIKYRKEHAKEIAAKQKLHRLRMDQEKRKQAEARYRANTNHNRMAREASLLSIALSQK